MNKDLEITRDQISAVADGLHFLVGEQTNNFVTHLNVLRAIAIPFWVGESPYILEENINEDLLESIEWLLDEVHKLEDCDKNCTVYPAREIMQAIRERLKGKYVYIPHDPNKPPLINRG